MMRRKMTKRFKAALLTTQFFLQGVALAQVAEARIVGTVYDQNRSAIAGATVSIKDERTGQERTAKTNQTGQYIIAALKPSFYTVRISAEGFSETRLDRIQLTVGQELSLDIELKPAGVAESITVIGLEEPAIDTSSARIGASVNQREVHGLPINGRQLSQLYLQAPGSQNAGSGTFNDIRFSGRSNEQNIIRYDGIEGTAIIDASPGNLNGEVPSPFRLQSSLENVQEFRVESNTYPAEYGTGTGGQISVITKSGSNQFHGSIFEYLRNDALDARNFFDLDKKSKLRLNQFGGSFGGPIIKDKLFFFGSYEGYRLRAGINFIEAAPSLSVRSRAVPEIAPLIDAFRGPGAVILPNASANPDFDILQLNSTINVNENSASARFDYKASDRYSIYARFFRDQGFNDQPEGITGRRVIVRAVPQNGVLAFTGAFTANTINEIKFGYNSALTRINGIAPVVNGIDLSAITINIVGQVANVGIAGQGASSGVAIPGGLVRQNSATNGRGAPYTPYSLSFIDNLNWIRGSHAMKFGGEVRLIRMYTDRLGGTTYTFSNLNDFLANRAQQIQYLGDLSAPSAFNNGFVGNRKAEEEMYIAYAQDEWKVKPNLTINYGLRYEYYTPLREAHHADVVFDPIAGKILPPDTPFYTSLRTNFGPRIGITWSPNHSGGGRTVLRAGFGIYHGPGQIEDQIQPIESDRISSTLGATANAFPLNIPAVVANFINNPLNRQYQPRAYMRDRYRIPERVFQYSFSLQQELFYKLVLTVAYVGSQGRNLFLRSIANKIVGVRTNPDPTKSAVVVREFDIDGGGTNVQKPFAEIDTKLSGGHDSYNALQVSLVRRSSTGLSLNAQYTLSRSFGNSNGSNEALTAGNPFDFDYDLGYNLFDVRHSFNLSALYSLPIGKGKKYLGEIGAFGEAILGGWEIGAIVNARSGLPIDVRVVRPDVVYRDAAGNIFSSPGPGRVAIINTPGGGASRGVRRPDLIPGVNPFLGKGRAFLNPAAFAIPKPGQFGNLKRGALHGPNFTQFDLSLIKRLKLNERASLEFRAEIFNVFNHANFANPPATLPNALGTGLNQIQPGQPFTAAAAGNFGIINRTVERTVGLGTNRQIQLALRLNF